MGEIDSSDGKPSVETFYFVDEERLKERLAGDGPSFSVASLFSLAPDRDNHPNEDLAQNVKTSSALSSVFVKQSLFILDSTDSRISGIEQFFNVQTDNPNPQDVTKRRREIRLIVQNKFKRVERNRDKFDKSNRFSNDKRKFKKRKK